MSAPDLRHRPAARRGAASWAADGLWPLERAPRPDTAAPQVPLRARLRRPTPQEVLRGTAVAVLVVVDVLLGGPGPAVDLLTPGGGTRRRVHRRRVVRAVRRLRAGGTVTAPAALLGDAAWCPRHADVGTVRLGDDEVVHRQGLTPRPVALAHLTPVAARAITEGGFGSAVVLPGHWRVVDLVDDEGRAGALVAAPETLVLVAFVAGWRTPPPGWIGGDVRGTREHEVPSAARTEGRA